MVSLVLGVLDLFQQQYLLYVTDVYFAGRYCGGSVYHIASLEYIRLGVAATGDMEKSTEVLNEMQAVPNTSNSDILVWLLLQFPV